LQAVPWGKLFKAAKVAIKAVGVGRRLVEAYGRLKAAKAALASIPPRIQKVVNTAATTVKSNAAKKVDQTVKAAKDIGGKAKSTAKKASDKVKQKLKSTTEESCQTSRGAKKRLRSNSFTAGTLVLLADGSSKPIEKLQPGDTVKATNAGTGFTEPQQVTATVVGEGDKALVELTLAGAGSGGGGPPAKVTATAGHKFYSPGKGWTEAADLKVGDKLRDARGKAVTVSRTAEYGDTTTVYNLTVNDTHTYYVTAGETQVLVHNCSAELREYADSLDQRSSTIDVVSRLTTADNPAGYFGHNMNRTVEDLDYDAYTAIQNAGRHHLGCAEIGCISDAFEAGDSMRNAVMESVHFAPGTPFHLTPIAPCAVACEPLLPRLGIRTSMGS
jgi:hypothetical protein